MSWWVSLISGKCSRTSRDRCAGRLRSICASLVGACLYTALVWVVTSAWPPSINSICADHCSLDVPNSERTRRSSCNLSLSTINLSSATSLSRAAMRRSNSSMFWGG